MAPPKKRKVVKHLKKNWKKHTDIQDVEDFLEDKRLEERTGGIAAEKKDDQLFFLDSATLTSQTTSTVDARPDAVTSTTTTAVKKKRKIDEPHRCYANLQPDARVPLPNTTQDGEKGKKRKNKRLAPAVKRQTDPKLVKRLRASQKQHAINVKRKAAEKRANEEGAMVTRDLWESDDEMKCPTKEDSEDDDDDPLAFHKRITGVTRVAVPNSRDAMKRQASQLPAVSIPHPGASYNPDLGQYLTHLSAAHGVEEKKLKDEQKLAREMDAKFPNKEEAKKLASNWLVEMSGGLSQKEDDEDEIDVEEEEGEGKNVEKKGSIKRKTKKQKRKAKEQRTIQQKLSKKKTAKQRALEFTKLKTINYEISARERELSDKLKKKELLKSKREKAGITYRLGQTKYEPMDVEVKLTSELVGDLRSLVPEGNLLEDRYDNLKRRNMVAPGVRQKKGQRKFKLKKQEKRAWRTVTLDDISVPDTTSSL